MNKLVQLQAAQFDTKFPPGWLLEKCCNVTLRAQTVLTLRRQFCFALDNQPGKIFVNYKQRTLVTHTQCYTHDYNLTYLHTHQQLRIKIHTQRNTYYNIKKRTFVENITHSSRKLICNLSGVQNNSFDSRRSLLNF